jgi:hypothetical protein
MTLSTSRSLPGRSMSTRATSSISRWMWSAMATRRRSASVRLI